MDIESEISMEGQLSDFEMQFIKQQMQLTTKISHNDADSIRQKKQKRKAKIATLKQRVEQSTKNFQLSKMKLEYFANGLFGEIKKREEQVQRISVIIKEYQKEMDDRSKDIKDLQYLCSKKKETKDTNKSFGSHVQAGSLKKKPTVKKQSPSTKPGHLKQKSKDNLENSITSMKKKPAVKKQSPSTKTERIQKKSTEPLSARSKGKQKQEKVQAPLAVVNEKKVVSPYKSVLKKSSEKMQSTSRGKKTKERNFVF